MRCGVEQRERVAMRFRHERSAKGGVSLIPEFEAAYESARAGDYRPMADFTTRVLSVILKDVNSYADWYYGLGTAKRNAVDWLRKQVQQWQRAYEAKSAPVFLLTPKIEWTKALRTLEIASAAADVEQEQQHGPFTIVLMPGLSMAKAKTALEALDQATDQIRAKFPMVLYGKIFLSTHLSKKAAAWYMGGSDKFYLDVSAKKRFSDVYTICHELGHRHEHKFADVEAKRKFWDLSTRKVFDAIMFDAKLRNQVADEAVSVAKAKILGKPLPKLSTELGAWLRWMSTTPGLPDPPGLITKFLTYTIDEKQLHAEIAGTRDVRVLTDKLLHGPLAVTPYGATKPSENYAEAFAHYVLGMAMPPELAEVMASLAT
jgi:hypothetical protein